MADVVLKNVRKSFGRAPVIHGIDLDIKAGEFIVFVGPSGCGKSTLLRLIAGLEDISSGDLFIDGQRVNDLVPAKRGIAMVFQSYALYPHMSVYDNMAFGLELAKSSKSAIDSKVRESARMLQIETLLDRKPRQLSGGQRQRVTIGRAIVRDPKVFLFDEPLSNLDAALRVQTRIEIAKLHTNAHATMIYVTHDQVEAMTLADRIVVLNAGRIEQVGTPLELYHHPTNLFVAGFIGSPQMNFLSCVVSRVGSDGVQVQFPSSGTITVPAAPEGVRVGAPMTLGIRPDHVKLSPQGSLTGRIELVEELGENHLLYVGVGQTRPLTIRELGDARHKAGQEVGIALAEESCHLFRETGEALPRLTPSGMPSSRSPSPASSTA